MRYSVPVGDDLVRVVRKLAKSSYWQMCYTLAKETKSQLFNNTSDYTDLQILMVNYIMFYSGLNLDVAMGDVSSIVFENEIYEDAYSYYKSKKEKKDKGIKDDKKRNEKPQSEGVTWVLKRPKKNKNGSRNQNT
jgi:hypothetical protein